MAFTAITTRKTLNEIIEILAKAEQSSIAETFVHHLEDVYAYAKDDILQKLHSLEESKIHQLRSDLYWKLLRYLH